MTFHSSFVDYLKFYSRGICIGGGEGRWFISLMRDSFLRWKDAAVADDDDNGWNY